MAKQIIVRLNGTFNQRHACAISHPKFPRLRASPLAQQFTQPRDIRRDPPRLVFGEAADYMPGGLGVGCGIV
jgi:hypothetical protein